MIFGLAFDAISIAATEGVALTTYRVPYEKLGQQAFETLHTLMSGGSLLSPEIQIRGEIIVRKTA